MEVILTSAEVEELLKISKPTLWRLRRELNGFQVGTGWRYYQREILAYIKRQQARAQGRNPDHGDDREAA